ncbi:FAD-binding protein, partial [Streptomyces sp. MCAF7]
VLLRGLGLNFFDHMALLTVGRGGSFAPSDGGKLVYRPSGREPRLYAGSRRGIPYQARGDNAKGAHGRHHPLLLTPEVISHFRKRAESGDPPDFLTEVWPMVAKEAETVYYEALLDHSEPPGRSDHPDRPDHPDPSNLPGRQGQSGESSQQSRPGLQGSTGPTSFRGRFLATEHGGAEEAAVLDDFGIAPADRWCWDSVAHPHRG